MRTPLLTIAGTSLFAVLASGCVPQQKYDELLTAYRGKEQHAMRMQEQLDGARANEKVLRDQLTDARQKLDGLEDAHLLAGHLALIFDDHSAAQDHFLQSTRPLAALEMRRDLLHWEPALKLAKTLATEQVPTISREFAKQLEFRGNFEQAVYMFRVPFQ